MQVHMDYGRQGLDVQLDDSWNVTVIEASHPPEAADPQRALQDALRSPIASPPLSSLVTEPSSRVGIVFPDITRPMPRRLVIEALLAELAALPDENITLFNALGTHRPNTPAELEEMLGGEIVRRFRIVQNDAFDPATQASLG